MTFSYLIKIHLFLAFWTTLTFNNSNSYGHLVTIILKDKKGYIFSINRLKYILLNINYLVITIAVAIAICFI